MHELIPTPHLEVEKLNAAEQIPVLIPDGRRNPEIVRRGRPLQLQRVPLKQIRNTIDVAVEVFFGSVRELLRTRRIGCGPDKGQRVLLGNRIRTLRKQDVGTPEIPQSHDVIVGSINLIGIVQIVRIERNRPAQDLRTDILPLVIDNFQPVIINRIQS